MNVRERLEDLLLRLETEAAIQQDKAVRARFKGYALDLYDIAGIVSAGDTGRIKSLARFLHEDHGLRFTVETCEPSYLRGRRDWGEATEFREESL